MTCAKRQVAAVLVSRNGHTYRGTNDCAQPQDVCPREPGEGYEKCKSICQQSHHAEVGALKQAALSARGGKMLVFNHNYCCQECLDAMAEAGIVSVEFIE